MRACVLVCTCGPVRVSMRLCVRISACVVGRRICLSEARTRAPNAASLSGGPKDVDPLGVQKEDMREISAFFVLDAGGFFWLHVWTRRGNGASSHLVRADTIYANLTDSQGN